MPKRLDFRTLKANEIDVRVGNVAKNDSGFFLLLYKNARVDQCILDETVGQFNWKCNYYQVKNTMVCSVSIWNDERNEWVSKDNGGDDDYQAEQVKAELSDAFKRACFNWGIGRELYYSPKIWINQDNDNQPKTSHYSVKVIEYDENKRITKLVIVNDKTKTVVFSHGVGKKDAQNVDLTPKTPTPKVDEPKGSIDAHELTLIQNYIDALPTSESKERLFKWLDKNYATMNPEFLTKTQGKDVVRRLKIGD